MASLQEVIEWRSSYEKLPSYVDYVSRIKNDKDFIKIVLELHTDESTGSLYWIERYKDPRVEEAKKKPTQLNLAKLAETGNIYEILKQEKGYDDYFMPQFLRGEELFTSCSSGTTGAPKCVKHDKLALMLTAKAQYDFIKRNYDVKQLKGKLFVCAGPYGGYQYEGKVLADLLEMKFESLPFDTTGIKLKPPEELQKIFANVISKIAELLSTGDVGFLTGSPIGNPTAGLPKELWYKNKFIFRLSGAELNYDSAKLYEIATGGKVFPMFGHFAGKSAPGLINDEEKSIVYYSPHPVTYYPVINNWELVPYGKEGRVYTIVVEPALLLSSPDDVATRSKPKNKIDGIKNIHR